MTTDTREFRLELFTGKVYEPIAAGPRRALASMTEGTSQPWRLVLPEKAWPAKPVFRARSRALPCSVADGSNGRMLATVAAYLAWAREHGLKTVTVYRGSQGERMAAATFDCRVVDAADFLGDAPVAEMEA